MKKEKIAISIDEGLLDLVEDYVDNEKIVSRSQAIEFLVRKALKQGPPKKAVLLIREKEQKHLFENFGDKRLIDLHFSFLMENRIEEIYLVSKITEELEILKKEAPKNIKFELVDEKNGKGTAAALNLLKNKLKDNFVVINADTFNDFNLKRMVREHLKTNAIATIGLISSNDPEKRGSVILDGNHIVDFKEKEPTTSNVISAGIYIFNSKIFDYMKNTESLERDVFTVLASKRLMQGFFTFGRFIHMPDKLMEMPLPEIIDRFTIVKLKRDRIGDPEVVKEYEVYEKALEEYKERGLLVDDKWIKKLYEINSKMWDLEHDLRKGKDEELGLEEIGRRAIAIRDWNKKRVEMKNKIAEATKLGFRDIKKDHGSE